MDNDVDSLNENEEIKIPEHNSILRSYLRDISKYSVLSVEETKRLTEEYARTQDDKLRTKLINHNYRLVVKIAFEYVKKQVGVSFTLDLIQEGNLGLMEGIKNFDPKLNVPLANYVGRWIRAYILRYITKNFRLVKLGTTETQRKIFWNLAKESAKLEILGQPATPELLAAKFGTTPAEIEEMRSRISNNEMTLYDNEGQLLPLESDEDLADQKLEEQERLIALRKALAEFGTKLSLTKFEVFRRRFLAEEQETLTHIAAELKRFGIASSMSRQRVQQIDAELVEKLRTELGNFTDF